VRLLFALFPLLADVAQAKIDTIVENRAAPGSVVAFSPAECNAWAHARLPALVPKGIRNEVLDFGYDTVTGSALMDFLAIREGLGLKNGAIFTRLLSGERPVKANVRVVSANGQVTVYLLRLEVGGVVMAGYMLDTLIDNVLRPVYPGAKVNQPIALDYRIERVEVRPTGVRVAIKK
jgi:hypothetical protein